MSISFSINSESRQNLGISGVLQQATASFGASDYPKGGYPVYASAVGLAEIRSLIPCAYSAYGAGTPADVEWRYINPLTPGNAVTNPGFLVALEPGASNSAMVEVSASSNFNQGNMKVLLFGF